MDFVNFLPETIIGLGLIFSIIKFIIKGTGDFDFRRYVVLAFVISSVTSLYVFGFAQSKFEMVAKLFILACSSIIMFCTNDYKKQDFTYKFFINASLFGSLFCVSVSNFLEMFVGLELSTIPLYFCVYYNERKNPTYFTYNLLGTAIEVFAISVIYSSISSLDFYDISVYLSKSNLPLLKLGIILLAVAFCVKTALFPFSKWAIDLFQKSTITNLSFVMLISKCALFIVMVKVFKIAFHPLPDVQHIAEIIIVISLVGAGLLAIYQNELKKLLALISIEHSALILLSLLCRSNSSVLGSVTFITAEILALLCLFVLIDNVYFKEKSETFFLKNLSMLSKKSTLLSLGITVAVISLAGIPPVLGFWGKYYILLAFFEEQNYFIAFAICITTLFAAIYSAKILKNLWKTDEQSEIKISNNVNVIYVITLILIIAPIALGYLRDKM